MHNLMYNLCLHKWQRICLILITIAIALTKRGFTEENMYLLFHHFKDQNCPRSTIAKPELEIHSDAAFKLSLSVGLHITDE